jgi:carnitine O-acetyltransferase
MMKPEEAEEAEIFSDPIFQESTYFKLSTSNMSPGEFFYGGFGPVVPDGYGVNYAIGQDTLKFSISARKAKKVTNCYKLRQSLEKTLKDMLILFPKRTEVWGVGWEKRLAAKRRDDAYIKQMRKLSNEHLERIREKFKKE